MSFTQIILNPPICFGWHFAGWSMKIPDITKARINHASWGSGTWSCAVRVLDSMEQAAVYPDIFSLTGVMKSCERNGKWQESLRFFEARAKKHQNHRRSMEWAFMTKLFWWKCLCLRLGPHKKEDTICFGLLLFPILGEMYWVVWGLVPHPLQGSKFSYAAALSAYATGKQWQQAFQQLVPQMVRKRMQLDVIEFNASMSCVGCWEEVQLLNDPHNFCNTSPNESCRNEIGESVWKETLRLSKTKSSFIEAFVFSPFIASFLSF